MVRQEEQRIGYWEVKRTEMILREERQSLTGAISILLARCLLFHFWHCINWDRTIYYLTGPHMKFVKRWVIHKTLDAGESKFRRRTKETRGKSNLEQSFQCAQL